MGWPGAKANIQLVSCVGFLRCTAGEQRWRKGQMGGGQPVAACGMATPQGAAPPFLSPAAASPLAAHAARLIWGHAAEEALAVEQSAPIPGALCPPEPYSTPAIMVGSLDAFQA